MSTKFLADHQQINHLIISETAKLLGKSIATQEKIENVLKLLTKWANLYFGRVLLPDFSRNELQVAYHYGLLKENLDNGKYVVPFDKGLSGFVWRSGQADLVIDINKEQYFLRRIAEPIDGSIRNISFISIPIVAEGITIGILSAQRSAANSRPYSCDLDLLKIIAAMFGPILFHVQQRAQQFTYMQNQLDKKSVELMHMCEAHGLIGNSRTLLEAVQKVDNIRNSNAPVILLGESGTGKEMFANMIHKESKRKNGAFIAINCASIPEQLLESELFGHEKGSFTGAHKHKTGKMLRANGGTLFLDEIGDMPLDLQVKLLRVLQEKMIEPVGGNNPIPIDIRIITATNVNLKRAIEDGKFRLDLYFRLNVVPIYLPPLRNRKGDIPKLALYIIRRLNELYDKNLSFTQGAIKALEDYLWPGNIRQLENVIERAVLHSTSPWITVELIKSILQDESVPLMEALAAEHTEPVRTVADAATAVTTPPPADDKSARPYQRVNENDREMLISTLQKAKGNQKRAAEMLNMTARQFRYRLAKLHKTRIRQTDNC
jgi:Nif-specific regulatory protein